MNIFLIGLCLASGRSNLADQLQSIETPTFEAAIKPIIDKKCITCHQKGGAAPFPLQTYAQVKKRADLCERMMLTRMMPPTYARGGHDEFSIGGGPLTDEELVILQRWVQAGAPEGNPTHLAPLSPIGAWQLGKPDAILKPRSHYELPEEGRPYWRTTVIPLGGLKGKKVRAFEIRVDQPQALRSAILAIGRDGLLGTRRANEGFTTGGSLDIDAKKYIGTWAAGYPAWQLPQGVAMTLDGDSIVVQMLILPRGKVESGDFELALYFDKSSKPAEAKWLTIGQEEFSVPAPGSLVLTPGGVLPPQTQLIAVLPEARFFCTSIRLWNGDDELFVTRRWEPYWQGVYRFPTPISLPNGADLKTEFNFDNDIHMGRNEGRRPRPILPGYRERDELCRIHILYSTTK